MIGALCLAVLLCSFIPSNALLINISSSRVVEKYDHMIASFGPDYDQFNYVKGDLVFAGTLCPSNGPPSTPWNGSIVFAWRGECTFVEKVYFAQQNFAVGVVVGNFEDGYVRMGSDSEISRLVTIPSVFISQRPAKHLVELMDTSLLVATISETGEASLPPPNDFWNALQWIFYITIFGFLSLGVFWTARRVCYQRHMQRVRTNYTRRIPVVEYRAPGVTPAEVEEKEADARTPLAQSEHRTPRVLNETCAICLDDFTAGQRIKVLPCHHGFHIDCIDPWLNDRSEQCPVCKASILDGLPPERAWYSSCWPSRQREQDVVEAPQSPGAHPAPNNNAINNV